jgi:phosphoribosylformylglycinamidine synthase
MTNCLNFGNPEKPDVYYQLSEAIRGMADGARALGIPVVSGNVSLYNETNGEPIWPTPVVGVVGLLDDADRAVPTAFQNADDVVLVVGPSTTRDGLAASEVMRLRHSVVAGAPQIDVGVAAGVQRFLLDASSAGLLKSAHDVSAGGLAVALAESCVAGDIGAEVSLITTSAALFSESQATVIVSCASVDAPRVMDAAQRARLHAERIGSVGGDTLRIRAANVDTPVLVLREAYESGLPRALEGSPANL